MLDTLAIARRIKSRFHKISDGHAAGPLRNGRNAYAEFITDGRVYRAYVSPLVTDKDPRPAGFDHIFGERLKVDQLRLAELASKSLSEMARVSKIDTDLAHMEPWHKNGVAGFVVHCTSGTSFLVEVSEVSFEHQLEEAKAKIAAVTF